MLAFAMIHEVNVDRVHESAACAFQSTGTCWACLAFDLRVGGVA
jgi:hypothetical protein